AEVERIFGKNPEAVYCFGLLPECVSLMKEVYRGGFESKVVALSIMADAEGKFVQAVGPKVAEGIRHFQPMPDVSAPGYKKFLQLMDAPADRVLLFPPNTHDQIAITALAMEKAKSPMAVDWSKQIIPVGNGPGQEVDDVVEALKLVRAGTAINFQGAGSTCDFTPNGDQLGRGRVGHLVGLRLVVIDQHFHLDRGPLVLGGGRIHGDPRGQERRGQAEQRSSWSSHGFSFLPAKKLAGG